MTCLKRRAVGARVSRGGVAAMAVMMLAGGVQGADIRSEIETLGADWYWPMEYGLFSEREYGTYGRVYFEVQEANGASVRHANHGSASPLEYLPMLPAHMTEAPTSPALIFDETTGVLTSANRALYANKADFDNGSGTFAPLSALGMYGNQNPWTIHVIVGGDADDSDARGEETVFFLGTDADMSPYPAEPNIVELTVDRTSTGTTYTLTRDCQGQRRDATVTIPHPMGYTAGDRQWHQVFAEHTGTTGSKIKLSVREAGGSLSADDDTSSAWLFSTDAEEFYIGADRDMFGASAAKRFHGAMHHFAVWRSGLTGTEKDDLGDAWTTVPTARADHEIDWGADLRFFVWTTPVKDYGTVADPTAHGSDRDMLSWIDKIWDRAGVYPIVRFQADRPNESASIFTPPGYSAQAGETPTDIANQAMNWIEYMSDNLENHTVSKSLGDGIGYSFFMQNWGNENASHEPPGIYRDRWASRALTTNWRDMSADWRVSDTNHLNDDDNGLMYEGEVPYNREGMSINAARTAEVFVRLSEMLADGMLAAPGRFHLDHEIVELGYRAFRSKASPGMGPNPLGWWHAALGDADFMTATESRVDDPAHFSGFGNTLDDFRDSLGTDGTHYDSDQGVFNAINNNFRSAYRSFSLGEYEHALNNALLRPALELLNPDIRSSEYGITQSSSYTINTLDYSAFHMYPRKGTEIDDDISYPGGVVTEVYLDDLFTEVGLVGHPTVNTTNLHNADPDVVKRVLDDLYVERWKVAFNNCYVASGLETGKPHSPWLPVPGWSRSLVTDRPATDQDLFDRLPSYLVEWEEVARLAVFAQRRGVSEFIFWCDNPTVSYTGNMSHPSQSEVNANVAGFESIIQAVEYAKASRWDVTTTGHTTRGQDLFGIPDGTIDCSDYDYLVDRITERDLEGDLSGPTTGYPDGVVTPLITSGTSYDWVYFMANFPMGCP